jgi:glycosyltransferase involved in cell wall biosynthesis
VERRGWADQDRIISISPYVRERLSPLVTGVIHDIDNPVREDFFDVPRRDTGGTIFTASVINARKNVLTLVDAVALLRRDGVDATLRVAGPVTDASYGRSVRAAIERHGLGEHVHLLGPVPAPAIQRELTRASAFALVSLEENSPMGIEEAMAAGVPVVTSNRCGMPYMVRDGDTGFLVNPMDARDIAESLRVLLERPALRASMGQLGRAVARDRFHPDAVARRTRDVYHRTLGTPLDVGANGGLAARRGRPSAQVPQRPGALLVGKINGSRHDAAFE